jgi:hypothetical protein
VTIPINTRRVCFSLDQAALTRLLAMMNALCDCVVYSLSTRFARCFIDF